MKILLAAATEAEIAPTIEWLRKKEAVVLPTVEVLVTGVGLMAATFALTRKLSAEKFDLDHLIVYARPIFVIDVTGRSLLWPHSFLTFVR